MRIVISEIFTDVDMMLIVDTLEDSSTLKGNELDNLLLK